MVNIPALKKLILRFAFVGVSELEMENASLLEGYKELGELKKSIHNPNNYYQQELSKSIDERIALEDMNQQMHEELTLLKATVSEKIASLLLVVLLMIRLVGVRIVD